MAKAQETLIVELGKTETEIAFRKAALMLGTIRELEEGHFSIKEADNGYSAGSVTVGSFGAAFSTDKVTNPATVDIYIQSKTIQQTEVIIVASCFGGGPVQNNHCKAKLSTVKSAIMVAISEMPKRVSPQVQAETTTLEAETATLGKEEQTTQQLPQLPQDRPLITVVKTEENSKNQTNTYKILAIVFAVITVLFYVVVAPFWYHVGCSILILVSAGVTIAFSVVALKRDKDWFVQSIVAVMITIIVIVLRITMMMF